MYNKLEVIITILESQIEKLKQELEKLQQELMKNKRKSIDNQEAILNKLVPDKKISTVKVLKIFFPKLLVETKKKLWFINVANITLEKLRNDLRILVNENIYYNNYMHFELKEWHNFDNKIKQLEELINNNKQETKIVENSLISAKKLLEIEKNKINKYKTVKIKERLNDLIEPNNNPIDVFPLWNDLFKNTQLSREILEIEHVM
ncbi:MAG: hypothetical protein Q8K30_03385 [Candidatus Gracilibacteria bacterium]|nr:hypothetical protein [Candidatus Gracilibacteria bacterium]MDP2395560.1 hypothetical protein [bacterium]MDP3380035.1 hypothetical protein [bacterium]